MTRKVSILGVFEGRLNLQRRQDGWYKVKSPIWNGMIKDLENQGFQVKVENGEIQVKNND